MTVLSISNVSVEFGATTLLRDVTFTVGFGDRWGIVGRNGTGKTTLFRLITGDMQPSSGAIARAPGTRFALLEQHRDFGNAETVWDAAAGQFEALMQLEHSLARQADEIAHAGENVTEKQLEKYSRDLERFEHEGGYAFQAQVDAVLDGLGFDHVEARTRPLARLSGGERGRLGLARQLVSPAEVLLLDEPTNHLDLETTRWLEDYLKQTDKTVILVSHDRAFLGAVADHVLHFEAGTVVPYAGGYAEFVRQRAERRLAQQREFEKQSKKVAAEEDYIRRNIAGQNSKQAKGRRKRLHRLPRLSPPVGEAGTMALRLEVRDRGGDQVLVARHADIQSLDGQEILVEDLNVVINRQDVLGLVGPNGAGKSTLLRTIMREHKPASGLLRLGDSITVAYYRQDLAQVPMGVTLYEIIQRLKPQWERNMIQGHLGRFGFSGDEALRTADKLSGGERARVALAMMMLSGANVLILDEPTNHLDVESIEALEDAIDSYDGTVLLVSHDRELLRALTTRVWSLDRKRIADFDGGFAEWEESEADRRKKASEDAIAVAAARRERERRQAQQAQARKAAAPAAQDAREQRRAQEREVREAQRALERAERRVSELDARVAQLTKDLDDASLYATPDGVQKAAMLGAELERARAELEAAVAQWERASAEVEAVR
ncbi:MAG: ABC-F family ATP-binding cassette domain-containing protein [Gemmatimonadaceae bacterium]